MGNYDASAERLENQLIDWYEAYKSGDYATADRIEEIIVGQGLISETEFNNVIVPDSYNQSTDSWLDYSSDSSSSRRDY